MNRLKTVICFGIALCGCGGAESKIPTPTSSSPKEAPQRGSEDNPRLHAETATDSAMGMANSGDIDGAMALLTQLHREGAGTVQSHLMLGSLLDFDGRPEEAIRMWEAGCNSTPEDITLLMTIAGLRREQAKNGAQYSHRRGIAKYRPKQPGEPSDETYRKERLSLAVAALDKARSLSPQDLNVLGNLAETQMMLEQYAKALPIWEEILKQLPDHPIVLSEKATALFSMKRHGEALIAAEAAVASEPATLSAHELILKIYEAKGEKERAETAKKQVVYYRWMPPFIALPYTEERYAFVAGHLGEGAPMQNPEVEVDTLVASSTLEDQAFLAAICHHHEHHGPIEDRAYAALEKAGAVELLSLLLENATSICTVRSTGKALARLKAPRALPLLVDALPEDIQMAHQMDVAKSLAILGDERAVAPLIDLLAPQFVAPEPESDPMMMALGRRMARERAAIALGHFDTKASKAALNRCLENSQVAPGCVAALYLLEQSPRRLAEVRKQFEKEAFAADYYIAEALRETGDEAAGALADEFD